MRDTECCPVTISIDMKKYRIRVHKTTLHLLGDPKYIQFLVNPDDQIVAIRSVERSVSGDQTHRVSKKTLQSDNSVEFYSRSFISALMEVAGDLDKGHLFRMEGKVITQEKVAVFSMKSLQQLSS